MTGGAAGNSLNGGPGADLFQGGLGRDTASYAGRSASVHVTLDLSANDGALGEGDNAGGNVLDVEQVVGSSANDVLTLEFVVAAPVSLRGGPGNDVISAEAIGIGDTADGGPDRDTCRTDASDFRISCER